MLTWSALTLNNRRGCHSDQHIGSTSSPRPHRMISIVLPLHTSILRSVCFYGVADRCVVDVSCVDP